MVELYLLRMLKNIGLISVLKKVSIYEGFGDFAKKSDCQKIVRKILSEHRFWQLMNIRFIRTIKLNINLVEFSAAE